MNNAFKIPLVSIVSAAVLILTMIRFQHPEDFETADKLIVFFCAAG